MHPRSCAGPVRELENVFIPLGDGTRLAARIWLPANAEDAPAPAILEYIPYRKRDFMRTRDEPMHRYYASHGYAALRVDLRGSGDSDGVLIDEYLPQEQADALEVIAWIAAQPWCDGNVGMQGISWGGFNALQVAALRPAALKAIITLCASDDRYTDDAHYMGGCLLNENQIWGTALFALNALPPDPLVVGECWREMWLARLAANRPFPAVWLEHPWRDAFWKNGSVGEDFSRIECPVYAIGGWADGYSNAVPRLLEGLRSPCKGLIGPWSHRYPHLGVPGPAIGYLQEALRWWDRWLRGQRNGIEEEPLLRVWMQAGAEPELNRLHRPGRWVAEAAWPSPRIRERVLHFGAVNGVGILTDTPRCGASAGPMTLVSAQSTGVTAGVWCEFGADGEAPGDQRPDDGRSLVFDQQPLDEALEILGSPRVRLRLAVDRPVAAVVVRLNEVFASGASSRVTYGMLNLTHRDSHEHPQPVAVDAPIEVQIELNATAHRFEPGSRIRVAISTAYWPMVWPSPRPVWLSLCVDDCSLVLPARPADSGDATLPPFAEPESADLVSEQRALQPLRYQRTLERDLTSDRVTYRMLSEGGDLDTGSVVRIDAIDLDLGHRIERVFEVGESDPLAAQTSVRERLMLRRGDWHVTVDARTTTSATEDEFVVEAVLDATENDRPAFCRRWTERIPRRLL